MLEALEEARLAGEKGEIPIGAVIVKDGVIIGRGHNLTETEKDPTAHAEIVAIRQAAKHLRDTLGWRRLTGCQMYVTVEPCSMCAGALVWARIEKVFIGAADPKAGGCGSVFNIVQEDRLNHRVELQYLEDGPIKEQCGELVRDFFRTLREGGRRLRFVAQDAREARDAEDAEARRDEERKLPINTQEEN